MNLSSLPAIAAILSLISLAAGSYALWSLYSLNKLRSALFTGATGEDLESVLQRLAKEVKKAKTENEHLKQDIKELRENFNFAVQRIGIVRFNPFDDGGGNFSFSLALLDGRNSGVVVTSMHGRQQNRIYAKNINNGASDTALTEEEQQAIKSAKK